MGKPFCDGPSWLNERHRPHRRSCWENLLRIHSDGGRNRVSCPEQCEFRNAAQAKCKGWRQSAREGSAGGRAEGRAPGNAVPSPGRPYLDRHGFGACDLQFEAWAGEASVRLGGALVSGGLAYVALTGTPSPNCSSGSRVVMRPSDQPWRRNLLSPADPAFLRAKAARNMRRDH